MSEQQKNEAQVRGERQLAQKRHMDAVQAGNYMPEHIMSPEYRFGIAELVAQTTGCQDVLLFDDVANAVDPSQRGELTGLAGYERAMIAGIPFSVSMNVHILMQALPLPAEMELAHQVYEKVPDHKAFHVWVPQGNTFVDAFALYQKERATYIERVRQTFAQPPQDNPRFHVEQAKHLLATHDMGKTLVMPFQTTDWHHSEFSHLVTEEKVVLPDSAQRWISKGDAAEYFEITGVHHMLPETRLIRMDDLREISPANMDTLIQRVTEVCEEMIDQGKNPYVKLVSAGVSGIGNVAPKDNPLLRDNLSTQERHRAFAHLARERLQAAQAVPDAVVEEAINIVSDNMGRREFVASGIVVNGTFYPWSVSRTINNESDVYQGVMCSPNPEDINVTPEQFNGILHGARILVHAMSQGGYSLGYAAKDLVQAPGKRRGELRDVIHDHNDRRGGRSVNEVLTALLGQAYHDKDYVIDVPEGADPVTYILQATQNLAERGFFVYGSATAYFPKTKPGHSVHKLKILSPMGQLQHNQSHGETITTTAERVVQQIIEGNL